MEYIPLVFFVVVFLFIIHKRGFDASAYITLLYILTSVFSLLMFKFDMVDDAFNSPSLSSTIIYCLLIFISIIPIYNLNISKIELVITDRTKKIVNYLTYVFFINFVVFLILRFNDIYRVLIYGDFLVLRQDFLDDVTVRHAHGFIGALSIITNILSSISFVMVLVFFVSVSYFNKSWKFNLCALLGSITTVLGGVLTINRSNIFYYAVVFGLCCVIFWRRISNRIKIRYFIPIVSVFIGMMVYFSAVTQDRFDNSFRKINNDFGGANNSLISYAGMAYSNFCYFFDNYDNQEGVSTRFLLPVTNYLFNGYIAGTEREQEQTLKTGFNCVVFMTFLGSFIMDSNQYMPFIFIVIYLSLFYLCRKHINNNSSQFVWLLAVFLLMTIPAIGCITYYYNNPFRSMALYVLLFVVSKF